MTNNFLILLGPDANPVYRLARETPIPPKQRHRPIAWCTTLFIWRRAARLTNKVVGGTGIEPVTPAV